MTDDDVRSMLRAKAEEATVSPDAWEQIQARIAAAPAATGSQRLVIRAGAALAAAAAVAGVVVVAQNGPTQQVADAPRETTTTVLVPAAGDPVDAATQWLQERFPEVDVPTGRLQGSEDGNASVVFRGAVDTEVFVRQLSGRSGWAVVAAASDMIPMFDLTFDGTEIVGRATAEAEGRVVIDYLYGEESVYGGTRDVQAREDVVLGHERIDRVEAAAVRIVLVVDGTRYLSERAAEPIADPAQPTGSHVAVWPATDSAGLASLQQQADDGFRDDLLDPRAVAGAFLGELLPRGETPTSYETEAFQRGDTTSGEVPYRLSDGSTGVVLVRTLGEEGSIWYVTGATSDVLEIVETRREETHLVVDVRATKDGRLVWPGATPIEVRAGQTVSIGRPDTPIGRYPVVLRLMDGERTLALTAALGD